MNVLIFLKEILRGKDLYRILMNAECAPYELKGLVLDVGSGEGASYLRFFKKGADAKVVSLDLKTGIDFEKDRLPYAEGRGDTVLAFNVLEHVYHYPFLVGEMYRVLRPGCRLIGAVPFLFGYHPDPRDSWRFTSESLERTLRSAGFKTVDITVFGTGPWSAAFSQIEFLIPRIFKLIIVPLVFFFDWMAVSIRPRLRERFPLGYFFVARK